jgi:hypothetical protein
MVPAVRRRRHNRHLLTSKDYVPDSGRQDRELIRTTAGGKGNRVIIKNTGQQAFHQLLTTNAVPEMAGHARFVTVPRIMG